MLGINNTGQFVCSCGERERRVRWSQRQTLDPHSETLILTDQKRQIFTSQEIQFHTKEDSS